MSTVTVDVAKISAELQALQRQRAIYMESRIMVANRLQALVAGTMGYHSGMKEAERAASFVAAGKVIKQIINNEVTSNLHALVMTHQAGINSFNQMIGEMEKGMVKMAKTLPVAHWVQQPNQRGFGLLFLAIVVGECGDLANYANPAKLWRRMGCSPWVFNGKTLMGATWKSGKEGKLPASEWELFGYSPRRRSISYLIGEGILRQNGSQEARKAYEIGGVSYPARLARLCGPYRARYDYAKNACAENHPDYKPLRCHLHGMLLGTKLLIKNLWIEWNTHPQDMELWKNS